MLWDCKMKLDVWFLKQIPLSSTFGPQNAVMCVRTVEKIVIVLGLAFRCSQIKSSEITKICLDNFTNKTSLEFININRKCSKIKH